MMSFIQKYLKHRMKRFRMSLRSKLLAASSSKNNQHATNNSSKKVQIQTLTPEDLEILSNYNNYELLADQDSNYNYVCQICFESKLLSDSFEVKGCSHFYCIECIINYVSSKLDDNVTLIPCPEANCEGRLDPDFCHEILPSSLFERWGDALCESAVASHEKFYCPYEDCSALLIKDDDDDRLLNNNEGQHTNFPCIVCKRNLCVQCKVPWHSGMDCREFQKSKNPNYEEAMLVIEAKRNNWGKCPNCSCYVEKTGGCYTIKCRCGFAFCYNCGAASNFTHFCFRCYH